MEPSTRATPARRRVSGLRTDPRARRQLAERGPILFWRDGDGGRREGLVCLVSACANPSCACTNVYVTGLLIDERAIAVSGGAKSLRIAWAEDSDPPQAGGWPLRVTVDLEARTVSPREADVRADLVDWFRGELDDVLADLLQRRRRLAKR